MTFMRIVFYAVNGSGVGHLMRCIAVARNIRKLASERSLRVEIFFLTSSEATSRLFSEGFPAFKLPSRETIENTGFSADKFSAIATEWTRKTLELLSPDLLVVDTFPSGYYEELPDVFALASNTAIISRPVKFSNIDTYDFLKALERYDAVIVPESRESSSFVFPAAMQKRIKHFGAIMSRNEDELIGREAVRQGLGIPAHKLIIYVSAGGGGDENAEKTITHVYKSLRDLPNIHFVIGVGPLYRGGRIYDPNVIWFEDENAFEMMKGFDIAISAAGYNTFHELMFTGTPTIFLPQEKWADDQLLRAKRAAEVGAATFFESMPLEDALRQAVFYWNDRSKRQKMSLAAKLLVPKNHASEVAEYLIQLLKQTSI